MHGSSASSSGYGLFRSFEAGMGGGTESRYRHRERDRPSKQTKSLITRMRIFHSSLAIAKRMV